MHWKTLNFRSYTKNCPINEEKQDPETTAKTLQAGGGKIFFGISGDKEVLKTKESKITAYCLTNVIFFSK